MEQAYLYRMAATINMDRAHFLDDPDAMGASGVVRAFQRDKVQLFCTSMAEIEKLRAGQIDRLMRSLHVSKFPEHVNISDPDLMPFLAPKVRAVVEAFPLQAEAIVKRNGLQSEEFNQMLQATRTNPIFRWKIQKQMRTKEEEEAEKAAQAAAEKAAAAAQAAGGGAAPSSAAKQQPSQPSPATRQQAPPRQTQQQQQQQQQPVRQQLTQPSTASRPVAAAAK